MQGKIIRGIAGFYYVHTEYRVHGEWKQAVYECKAKGVFRKDHRKPLVGDDVEMDVLDEEKKLGNIRQLLPSRNRLIRPAVANVDQALVIFSIVKPKPNFNLLDRFLIMMGQQGIPCVICFNKQDLDEAGDGEQYAGVYADCGYPTLIVSAKQGFGIEELKRLLSGKTTTVAGPSGVGKSSIVNCLQNEIVMETGQISTKIERGKHTTRHTELLAAGEDTYILDTPGFSSLELFELEKEQLAGYFPEFSAYECYCRFTGCSHIAEPVCGVRDAVSAGKISRMRYDNYCTLYEELKNKKRF
ncbi:MAG: ribosome small subunit-dependent GTPase A [Acetatifactor sp.]